MALNDLAWYINFGNGSTTGYYAVPTWPGALATVTAGTWTRQTTTPTVGNERCFVAVVAGTAGAVEPTWVVTRGAKTTDGTVTWQECTGVPGPCGDLTFSNTWTTHYKNSAVTLGAVIYDSVSASLQICSTAGTAGNGALPSFSATAGTTTADNTATWTSLGPVSNYTTAFKYPHNRLNNSFTTNWGRSTNTWAVSSIHAETQASAITYLPPSQGNQPAAIYCISNSTTLASPTLATTATVATTGANNLTWGNGNTNFNNCYVYGIGFSAGSSTNTASVQILTGSTNAQAYMQFDNCIFTLGNTSTSSRFIIGVNNSAGQVQAYIKNSSFVFGNASQGLQIGSGLVIVDSCTIAGTGTVPSPLIPATFSTTQAVWTIRNTDMSRITGTVVDGTMGQGTAYYLYFENCKLGAGATLVSGTIGQSGQGYIKFHNCDSAATNYRYGYFSSQGSIQQETTIVRTSGSTNRTTPISWNMTTNSASTYINPLVGEEISFWNTDTGSAKTVTIYLTTNTTLTNADFWCEVEYLSSSSSPLGAIVSSRNVPLATPITLTSDTSTWGGSITNKYVVVLTYTPQAVGFVKVRPTLAKTSVTAYVNLLAANATSSGNIKSTGRQYFIPGWGLINENAPSLQSVRGLING